IRIIDYFNISDDYESYNLIAIQKTEELVRKCKYEFSKKRMDHDCNGFINYKNFLMNDYFNRYKTQMLANLSFHELYDKFTVKANELINCTYFRNKTNDNSSDSHVMTDCSQSYAVLETIYGNKDFGICFTYFYTNHNNYYLKDKDYVEL